MLGLQRIYIQRVYQKTVLEHPYSSNWTLDSLNIGCTKRENPEIDQSTLHHACLLQLRMYSYHKQTQLPCINRHS